MAAKRALRDALRAAGAESLVIGYRTAYLDGRWTLEIIVRRDATAAIRAVAAPALVVVEFAFREI